MADFASSIPARVPALLRSVRDGELRLPHSREDRAWGDGERLALFDSIYRGIPVGGLLVWFADRQATRDGVGPYSLRAPRCHRLRPHLIDGLQRVLTLFSSLGAAFYEPAERPADANDSGLVFDLISEEFKLKTAEESPTLLPLSTLLDNAALFEFLRRLEGRQALGNRAESLAARLRDCTLPLTTVFSKDPAHVRTVVQRVNTGGRGTALLETKL